MPQNTNGKGGPGLVAWSRPETLESKTTKVVTGHGNLYVTISEIDGKPIEVLPTIGKSGGSVLAKAEAVGRMTSLALRYGVPVKEIVDQLIGIGGDRPLAHGDDVILSIPDAIAKVLKRYIGA